MSAILQTDSLSVRYGRKMACREITIAAHEGNVYALLGRNGSGKSSFLRCVLGQQKATSGKAFLFGRDSWRTRKWAMARTGVVPEEPDAPPEMTAQQLSTFCRRLSPRWDEASVSRRLDRFRVPRDVPFVSLSKGQKGQVMLTLALGHGPELLVLDDPTLGLDAIARREILEELVGELADRGTTVFLTTHDLHGIEGIADHVGILDEGRLVVDEGMESLKARFRRLTYRREVTESPADYGKELDAFDAARVRVRGWGIEAVVSNFTEEAFDIFRLTEGVEDAEASGMALEEIFVAVVGEEKESST